MNTKMPEAMQTPKEQTPKYSVILLNCKHLGLIVLSDVDSGRKFNVCMINLNFLAASVQKPQGLHLSKIRDIQRD